MYIHYIYIYIYIYYIHTHTQTHTFIYNIYSLFLIYIYNIYIYIIKPLTRGGGGVDVLDREDLVLVSALVDHGLNGENVSRLNCGLN
jgi:hypothetical protein